MTDEITMRDELLVAHALVKELLRERGDYVLALEQIRSGPSFGTSWQERYERCVKLANGVLNANRETRGLPR